MTGLGLGACAPASQRPYSIVADGSCPDLGGHYEEQGTVESARVASEVSHLSWLIDAEKLRDTYESMFAFAQPGQTGTYFAKSIVISHPTSSSFFFEALDSIGKTIGKFSFGKEDGWHCGEGAFFRYRADKGGGEASWGDRVRVERIFVAPNASLVVSLEWWYQPRSIFALGGPVASPSKNIFVHRYRRMR